MGARREYAVSHTRNAVRFAITVFWVVVAGLIYTAITNSGNAYALSWATWLFYAAVSIATLYAGAVLSKKLWSIK
jgi:hypothetical protein